MSIRRYLSRARGCICRWYRKTFHKDWDAIDHGLVFFQEFADLYGDSVDTLNSAEVFFNDFMKETDGQVIVDFLDTENWDCIRKIEVDKQNGLIWFYWQIPNEDPKEEQMKRMVFPLSYYGVCLKLDNVRFVMTKRKNCIGICVNGYTIKPRVVKSVACCGGWALRGVDDQSSFFSVHLIREKLGVLQDWRFLNTPISSFWIIPKQLNICPDDSKKQLYLMGAEKCGTDLSKAFLRIKGGKQTSIEDKRKAVKSSANEMRSVAECLFKLVMCFYQEQYRYKLKSYDALLLGDLTGPLKNSIYVDNIEQEKLGEIAALANDLSHYSGNPIELNDVFVLFADIHYFIRDFKSRIVKEGMLDIPKREKPSPYDYVESHYKGFCFKELIDSELHKRNGKISYEIRVELGAPVCFSEERSEEVLCNDGYIRDSKDVGADILKIWDRDEVISLCEKMYQIVKENCGANGYDSEGYLGISFDACLKKEAAPTHLFSEEEIEELMRNADDSKFNKLVIDENGFAQIIQNPMQGNLYPVSQETWCAGNMYVGKDSSLSDLHDSYVLCMHLWLAYLKTGRRKYDDWYVPDNDMDTVIEKVRAFY